MTVEEYGKLRARIGVLQADPELIAVLDAIVVYIGEVDDAADCAERDAREALQQN